jgi:hypothetical protein
MTYPNTRKCFPTYFSLHYQTSKNNSLPQNSFPQNSLSKKKLLSSKQTGAIFHPMLLMLLLKTAIKL